MIFAGVGSMKKKGKPDFLVVGAAKSGTTSLFHYLVQQQNVYIPSVKECRFFSQLSKNYKGLGAEYFPNSGITDEDRYFSFYKGHEGDICGDISNDYLYYYEESIRNIKKYLTDQVRIVVILRNPIDRAYSNYMHHVRDGWEDCSFDEAIAKEAFRINNNWSWVYHYIAVGMYSRQVEAYKKEFEKVRVFLYEDLKDRENFLNDLLRFLGLSGGNLKIDDRVYNVSGYPRSKMLHNFLTHENTLKSFMKSICKLVVPENEIIRNIIGRIKTKNLVKKEMNYYTREYLKDVFSDDIGRLSKIIGRDLSHWLQ